MSKKHSIVQIALLMLTVIANIMLFSAPAYADDTKVDINKLDHYLISDFFMPAFSKSISPVDNTPFASTDSLSRTEVNNKIATELAHSVDNDEKSQEENKSDKTYSLYDRFGPDLCFTRYYGEVPVTAELPDIIYNVIIKRAEDDGVFEFIKKLVDIFSKYGQTKDWSSNYKNRLGVLDDTKDPRAKVYKEDGKNLFSSAAEGIANYFLSMGALLSNTTGFFCGDKLFNMFFDQIISLFKTSEEGGNDLINNLSGAISLIFVIALIGMIVFIVKKMFDIVNGKTSAKEFGIQLLGSLGSIGLTIAFLSNPITVINITRNVMEAGTIIVHSFVNDNADEVVKSDIDDNTIPAIIWEKSVFDPWCAALFGTTYRHLYSKNAVADARDNEFNILNDGKNEDNSNKELIYSTINDTDTVGTGDNSEPDKRSIDHTGEPNVPLGNGKYANNWAALAYSCTSVYHLPSVVDSDNAFNNKDNEWPKTDVLCSSTVIYKDDFRYIDALLNVNDDWDNIHYYHFDGVACGFASIVMALLTIPLLIVGFKKTVYIILAAFSVVTLIIRSIMNIFLPASKEYTLISNLKAVIKHIANYIWYLFLMCVILMLYVQLTGFEMKGDVFLKNILYLILATYIMKQTPDSIMKTMKGSKKKIHELSIRAKKGINNIAVANSVRSQAIRQQVAENSGPGSNASNNEPNESEISIVINSVHKGKDNNWKALVTVYGVNSNDKAKKFLADNTDKYNGALKRYIKKEPLKEGKAINGQIDFEAKEANASYTDKPVLVKVTVNGESASNTNGVNTHGRSYSTDRSDIIALEEDRKRKAKGKKSKHNIDDKEAEKIEKRKQKRIAAYRKDMSGMSKKDKKAYVKNIKKNRKTGAEAALEKGLGMNGLFDGVSLIDWLWILIFFLGGFLIGLVLAMILGVTLPWLCLVTGGIRAFWAITKAKAVGFSKALLKVNKNKDKEKDDSKNDDDAKDKKDKAKAKREEVQANDGDSPAKSKQEEALKDESDIVTDKNKEIEEIDADADEDNNEDEYDDEENIIDEEEINLDNNNLIDESDTVNNFNNTASQHHESIPANEGLPYQYTNNEVNMPQSSTQYKSDEDIKREKTKKELDSYRSKHSNAMSMMKELQDNDGLIYCYLNMNNMSHLSQYDGDPNDYVGEVMTKGQYADMQARWTIEKEQRAGADNIDNEYYNRKYDFFSEKFDSEREYSIGQLERRIDGMKEYVLEKEAELNSYSKDTKKLNFKKGNE